MKEKDHGEKGPEWKHIPDSWLTAVITSTMAADDCYWTWKHLVDCEVCRDRYHDKVIIVRKQLSSTMPAASSIGQLLSSALLGSAVGKMASMADTMVSMTDMLEVHIDWDEFAARVVAAAEKTNEFDALTFADIGLGIDDHEHVKECNDCKRKLHKLSAAVKKLEKSLPHKKPTIDRVVEFLESFGKPEAKKSSAEETEHHDPGPSAFGA